MFLCSTHEAINRAKELLNYQPANHNHKEKMTQQTTLTQEDKIKTLTTAFSYFSRSITTEAKKYLQQRALSMEKLTVGYDANNFHKGEECTEELKEFYLTIGLLYPDKLGRENNELLWYKQSYQRTPGSHKKFSGTKGSNIVL